MIKRTKHLVRGIITTGAEFHHHSDDISEITHHSDLQITQLTYKLYLSLRSHLQKKNIFPYFPIYLFLLSRLNQEPEWRLMTRNLPEKHIDFKRTPWDPAAMMASCSSCDTSSTKSVSTTHCYGLLLTSPYILLILLFNCESFWPDGNQIRSDSLASL